MDVRKVQFTLRTNTSGLEVIKTFVMKFIMLINVKMPTIVGILIFISMIKTISES